VIPDDFKAGFSSDTVRLNSRKHRRTRAIKSEDNMNTPLAYSIAEASEVSRIGRTSIYEAISSRELIARKNGRRTVILADDLRQWLRNLPVTRLDSDSKSQTSNAAA
jgi:excisionase family DNA binding protein